MPGTVTLAGLVTRVRRRAGMENSTFCTDAEIEEYTEQSLGDLYDIILTTGGADFWQHTTATTATVSGTQVYLPFGNLGAQRDADIYKVIGVDVQWGGVWRQIEPYKVQDELSMEDVSGWTSPDRIFYRMVFPSMEYGPLETAASDNARHVQFIPAPTAVHNFRIRYIPVPGDWSTLGATYLFHGLSGWEEWVVCDAAAKCLEKEESLEQAGFLITRRDRAEDRIRWAAATMDMRSQGRIRDVEEGVSGPERALS